MAEVLQGGPRDRLTSDSAGTPTTPKFTITNFNEDLDFDCNANDPLITGDVLGTLINILIQKGIINGTVA